MNNQTLSFFKYVLGFRAAFTHDTNKELEFLASLAEGKKCIIEVGVFEGVASSVFCGSMHPEGKLYLVDPYFHGLKVEKLLNFSTTEFIAKRSVKKWQPQVKFIKETSAVASQKLNLQRQADLIFIDARHDYDSVLEDFIVWSPMVAENGVIAFHDSHICEACPELNEDDGPVRLCNEIADEKFKDWKTVETVDSITVVCKINAHTIN